MAYAVKYRRGTTAEHASFTGAAGEITVNTTTNQLIVHDGVTVGGHAISAGVSGGGGPSTLTDLNISDGTDGQVLTTDGTGTFTFTTVTNSGGSSQTSTIISPSAFAYVNTTSDGSGTNISWSNWNNSNGTMDFTFETAQPDVNYAVISDVEKFDDINIQVSSKSTTGFTITIYDGLGNVASPGITGTFSIIVYASTPTVEVNGSSNSSSVGSDEVYILADMPALVAKTGMSSGDKAYLTSNDNLYLYTGTGWYLIASVQNNAPSAITNVNSSYNLSDDGTPTVITAAATDPEGFPLTWSYAVTSGSLGATTISHTDNVFTITPSTNSNDNGYFTLTISATDGANGAVNTITSISLQVQGNIENSSNTTLLLTAVGASDNSIIDSSTNNYAVTTNGDAVSSTFSPYRSGGYSMHFDGSGDKLKVNGSPADFNFGTNSFTVEAWIYPTGAQGSIFNTHQVNVASGYYLSTTGSNNRLIWGQYGYGLGDGDYWTAYDAFVLNEWQHVSINRDADTSNFKMYVNGVLQMTSTNSGNLSYYTYGPYIGGYAPGGPQYDFEGYISDLVVTNGYVLRTGGTSLGDVAFTPPTEAFESNANTALLISNSPYIKDSSSNTHDITITGNVSTLPFTPYDYAEYNPTDHGGSVYFDGSGDNLVVSDALNLGTDDFTFEFWIYPEEDFTNTARIFISTEYNGSGVGWSLTQSTYAGYNGLTFAYGLYGSYTVGKFVNNYWLPQKQWTHVVAQRRNGTVEIYVNGVNQTLTTYNENSTFNDGADLTGSQTSRTFFNGVKSQVSSIRLVTGSYVYDGDFTPLTASLSSSAAELHITGTNASIIDKSQSGNRIQLIGGATGSNTESKFANSYSMYFDGSDDRLLVEDPLNLIDFSNGESYTLETWINATNLSGSTWRTICNQGTSNVYGPIYLSLLGDKLHALASHSGSSYTLDTRSDIGSSGLATLLPNTWYHIAYTWDGSNYKFYVNGVLLHTIAKTGSPMTTTRDLGIGARAGDYEKFSGYIQDFRITKGSVRYTANFTPPTSSLEG